MSWQDPISGTPSLHKRACCANSEHLLPSPGSKPLTSAALDALPAPCPHSLTPGIFHLCYFSCSAVCLSSRVGPSYKRDLTIFRPLARSLGYTQLSSIIPCIPFSPGEKCNSLQWCFFHHALPRQKILPFTAAFTHRSWDELISSILCVERFHGSLE